MGGLNAQCWARYSATMGRDDGNFSFLEERSPQLGAPRCEPIDKVGVASGADGRPYSGVPVLARGHQVGAVDVNPLPKIETLPGSVHIEWKRCGRANCRCQHGGLHGPYYARHWREQGRQRKAYFPRDEVAATLIRIELRHRLLPSASSMREWVRSAESGAT